MALTPGLLLSNRYRLTSRIAVGGMGEVWAADDTRLGREIQARLDPDGAFSNEYTDRVLGPVGASRPAEALPS